MQREDNATAKKRIILSNNRKTTAKASNSIEINEKFAHKTIEEFKEDESSCGNIYNCRSINSSLEIFDDDPKNRHMNFLEGES